MAAAGVAVRPLSDCGHARDGRDRRAEAEAADKGRVRLVMGYAHVSPARIRDGVRMMAAAATH
ncbi:hypothetical protein SALBM311S_06552 [Streptomyces alboniger]